MFVEWDFLLAEIWVLLALAVLIGLLAGWLIWGGRGAAADRDALFRLQTQLDRERARTRAALSGPDTDIPPMEGGGYRRPATTSLPAAASPTSARPSDTPTQNVAPPPTPSAPTPPVPDPATSKPSGLDAPRDGLPDDLTKISGVGQKLAKLCNDLGFYHYDQIAAWTPKEIAWVDDNLEGFKGRVTRDNWVDQAKALAKNDLPTFRRKH
ncbi:hypothetical protein [Pseudooctadecabacter jejudonensis]|uniref:NADH dehydrogenase subunit E n=1 Tax=Pseudooctadecabacter jejudonensis TaxID=1391910 RepID=A0A1Y5T7I6_9RHOB|nr:hypothetical protein [Pseudooctadecabacter jejudonensis]SLN54272.1 NADH dehydrogenase subunit E [Pseudooctadecabacter jejudonensis]